MPEVTVKQSAAPSAAVAQAVRFVGSPSFPARTPGVRFARALGEDANVLQVVETITEDARFSVAIVVRHSRAENVRHIYDVEREVRNAFPRAVIDVRVTKSILDPNTLPALTIVRHPRV